MTLRRAISDGDKRDRKFSISLLTRARLLFSWISRVSLIQASLLSTNYYHDTVDDGGLTRLNDESSRCRAKVETARSRLEYVTNLYYGI